MYELTVAIELKAGRRPAREWRPAYRVNMWRPVGDEAWSSEGYELSGIDAHDGLAWAVERATEGQPYTVFAVVRHDDQLGLVRNRGRRPEAGRSLLEGRFFADWHLSESASSTPSRPPW